MLYYKYLKNKAKMNYLKSKVMKSMQNYITALLIAALVFPILAFILTIPFMILQYHKYGAITIKKTLIIFSFIFYLLCVLCLAILPLPSLDIVSSSKRPWYNLKLFEFISEMNASNVLDIKDPRTYISIFTTNKILEPLFNILLTVPLGIYLRYYFKKGWFTTILYSFLLSLFLEVTQLSGLYYIYPRPYRLFDVNDLFNNTLGGLLGFILTPLFSFFLPTRDQLDEESLRRSKDVSFTRRFIGYLIDMILLFFILAICPIQFRFINTLIIGLYFSLSTFIFNGFTFGKFIVHIKLTNPKKKRLGLISCLLRGFIFESLILNNIIFLNEFNIPFYKIIIIQGFIWFILFIMLVNLRKKQQTTIFIDKLLGLEIKDTINHEERYILKL